MSSPHKITASPRHALAKQDRLTRPAGKNAGKEAPMSRAPDPSGVMPSVAAREAPPKLPHERDQSAEQDTPPEADKSLREPIERARRDLAENQEDTDCYGQRGLARPGTDKA